MAAHNIDHTEYPASLKSKSDGELLFTIQDCREVLEVQPESEKAGYYADEICYCAMELKIRRDKKRG